MSAYRRLTWILLLLSCLISTASAQDDLQPARLVHPEVAAELGLDDAQRAKLQQLLQERDAQIAAEPANAETLTAQFSAQMLAVLTPEQLKKFQEGGVTGKLMFNFSKQKWDAVLDWFARQNGLSLVMDKDPPETFSYSDTRGYTPAQGIDLLNSVLLTRGFTLIRQERMLIVIELSDSIPIELFPRVDLEDLPSRGRFEMVSVEFPTGGRPIDAVVQAVEPYLGNYGRAIPLANGARLLVIETAGKMETINMLIASVPVPKPPPQPQPPAKPPQPTFASYSLGDLDPQATLETIKSLVSSEQITVDERTRLLSAFVVPAQQTAINTYIEKMLAAKQELPARQLEIYRLGANGSETVQTQVQSAVPASTFSLTKQLKAYL